jgi:hypothetical protein
MINSIALFQKCDKSIDSLRKNFSYTLFCIIIIFGLFEIIAVCIEYYSYFYLETRITFMFMIKYFSIKSTVYSIEMKIVRNITLSDRLMIDEFS